MWHAQGTRYYLERQIKRMGSTLLVSRTAEKIPELVQLARLLSQLCSRYYAAKRSTVNGLPLFPKAELDGIKGTLGECEKEMVKLHMAAACAEEMLADAYYGLEIEPPKRPFIIISDYDANEGVEPLILENGDR